MIRRSSLFTLSLPSTLSRRLSTVRTLPDTLPHRPAFFICGAGTGVGKTVLSAALARAAALHSQPLSYIKPVQSGYPLDNDATFVASHLPKHSPVTATVLHTLAPAASPDLAARLSSAPPVSDAGILTRLRLELDAATARGAIALVEGAGGVLTPFPSGTTQADALRPLALPALLVGDPRLGGVSNTLAAREALLSRGYQVPAVVFFENETPLQENAATVRRAVEGEFGGETAVFSAPRMPGEGALDEYFGEAEAFFGSLLEHAVAWDGRRMQELEDMQDTAGGMFWYPFTQHAALKGGGDVTVIDSAFGNTFSVFDPASKGVAPMEDAIGSWWTTGVGHGDGGIARAIGAAAGRYGHVMFPEAAHLPAWTVAKKLLAGPGKGWAERVFFSDNGSTAVEVSLKMAFRKRAHDVPERQGLPVRAVTLDGCYHGDTLGVMDCAPKSDFNSKQTPWYESRAFALAAPTLALKNGVWTCVPADGDESFADIVGTDGSLFQFPTLKDALSVDRGGREYRPQLEAKIDAILDGRECDLGALLIEPVLLGAGGMHLVDPAYQRALAAICRERRIPVVYDEVFTGFWRLGRESAADILGVKPDIASYAKLLTGGVIPLAVTLATDDVFRAFLGDSKREALLHGHSYTAHPVGCAAAVEALAKYPSAPLFDADSSTFGNFWDEGLAREISSLSSVERVTSIGTVFAVELKSCGGGGYAANEAGVRISQSLRHRSIFSRPLGNIVYLMCSPMTSSEECSAMVAVLSDVLSKNENSKVWKVEKQVL